MQLGESILNKQVSEVTASVAYSIWLAWHSQEFRLQMSKLVKAESTSNECKWVFPYLGTASSLKC